MLGFRCQGGRVNLTEGERLSEARIRLLTKVMLKGSSRLLALVFISKLRFSAEGTESKLSLSPAAPG